MAIIWQVLAQSTILFKVFTSYLKIVWHVFKCMWRCWTLSTKLIFLITYLFYYTSLLLKTMDRIMDVVVFTCRLLFSLQYSNINPELGQKCGICTKAVSTSIAHQVRCMIFFPKIERLSQTRIEVILLSVCLSVLCRGQTVTLIYRPAACTLSFTQGHHYPL